MQCITRVECTNLREHCQSKQDDVRSLIQPIMCDGLSGHRQTLIMLTAEDTVSDCVLFPVDNDSSHSSKR